MTAASDHALGCSLLGYELVVTGLSTQPGVMNGICRSGCPVPKWREVVVFLTLSDVRLHDQIAKAALWIVTSWTLRAPPCSTAPPL